MVIKSISNLWLFFTKYLILSELMYFYKYYYHLLLYFNQIKIQNTNNHSFFNHKINDHKYFDSNGNHQKYADSNRKDQESFD